MPLPVGAVPAPGAGSSGSDGRPGYERSWAELTAEQQAACRVLGYDRRRWDEERSELAASRMMAAESDAEEQRRAQEASDAAAAAAITEPGARTHSGAPSVDLGLEEQNRSPGSNSSYSMDREDPFVAPPRQSSGPLASASFQVRIVDTELDEETKKVYYVMDIERSAASGAFSQTYGRVLTVILHSNDVPCCWQAGVTMPGGAQRVRKRYSEFEALRKELAGHSKSLKALDFPKKQRIKGKRGGRKEKTVDIRSSVLETWLNSAILVSQSNSQAAMLLQIIEDWFVALDTPPPMRTSEASDGGSYPGAAAAAAGAASGGRLSRGAGGPRASAGANRAAQDEALAQEEAELLAAIEASNAIAAQQGGQAVGSGPAETAPMPPPPAPSAADEEAEMLRAIQMSLGQSAPGQAPQLRLQQPVSAGPGAAQPATITQPPSGGAASVNNLPATLEAIEMGFNPEKVRRMQAQQQAATGGAFGSTQELLEALMSSPD